jgi:glycosyltransferase involved in cell wall biosynthesis
MNLLIFSPLSVASAIGRVTELVVSALVEQGHSVTIVRSEDGHDLSAQARPVRASVLDWNERQRVLAAAASADGIVYQVGDNYEFHRGCLEWLPRLPGIVCLHDYFVGSLFRRWARANPEEADAILRLWYSEAIARRYFSFHDPAVFVEKTAQDAPMTEWIASMAQAVVTHSSWGIARVLAACPGPVRVLALPYDAPDLPRGHSVRSADAFMVLTVGHVNANKRVESVIRAIAESDRLRPVATFQLVGKVERTMAERLAAFAKGEGVRLVVSGEVSDDALRAAIADADVISALRMPALESASASAIEAMLYGKPVIVMQTGFYQELPDDRVRKVSPEREVDDIRTTLEELQADPAARRALGDAAAAWATRTFRADTYATALTDLVVDLAIAAPILDAAASFARTLVGWGATQRIAAADEMVGPLRILGG